ncbi:hypothetical protein H4219_003109 [Mycoemilia scoparia]|uniref:Uncharacterized protein n=1 Tax=Mycoemilia scoparia TaxID=417184 RepID=A0A9W7ZZP2_9FUNG|nr:hypothetical protein H4219_003109 [Mycoemilia scoparia]
MEGLNYSDLLPINQGAANFLRKIAYEDIDKIPTMSADEILALKKKIDEQHQLFFHTDEQYSELMKAFNEKCQEWESMRPGMHLF